MISLLKLFVFTLNSPRFKKTALIYQISKQPKKYTGIPVVLAEILAYFQLSVEFYSFWGRRS